MKKPFYLILPDIRSCHNVGSIFRTADAFCVSKIFLAGYTASPPKIQIDKVALGAEKWVPWEKVDDALKLIKKLKKQGLEIIALEKNDESVNIVSTKFQTSSVLIMGNEVEGIDNRIMRLADRAVHIPMHGRKQSLNVSVAAGIAMHYIRNNLDN